MRTLLAALTLTLLAAPARAERCPADLPILFVVQDKSGSMNFVPDPNVPTDPTKWATASALVPQLATQFANRFRFGVHMYPGATTQFNCTVGGTVSPVGATPAQVATAYSTRNAGGGTPTAVSLDEARAYLGSLNDLEPKYVLLITDGLPNCNLGLDPATCSATTPGCSNNSCGLGAKDCLDDAGTRAAAAALLAQGVKVYVVGFGTSVTNANQKAVLDGIAQSGGTGSAYVANNQADLATSLNAIGYNAATCCKDACTAGAKLCTTDGKLQSCELDTALGCTTWKVNPCPAQSSCQNGTCVSCTNACTAGAKRCQAGMAQSCDVGANGCTAWGAPQACAQGQACNAGTCGSCEACTEGERRCSENATQICTRNATTGCTAWVTSNCAQGTSCDNGRCASCSSTCTAGITRCSGSSIETCEADAQGCTSWALSATCSGACNNGRCGACSNPCTTGEQRCNGGTVETCEPNSAGCGEWRTTDTCGAGQACVAGACAACPATCEVGAVRCGNGVAEECAVGPTGCPSWRTTSACADGSSCAGGECRVPCTGEEASVCGPDATCQQFEEGYYCVPNRALGDAPKVKSGCGCAGTDGGALASLALLALAQLAGRRKR
ncbi:MAG: VWA domain-containing protein [Deltaproteobacteria bacterium]|nr:VWA domain-containing protein [Deltaproteobacteria bacterium]